MTRAGRSFVRLSEGEAVTLLKPVLPIPSGSFR